MRSLNDNLLFILNNNLNISRIQSKTFKYFSELFDFFKQDKVLDNHYDVYYNSNFPIYPTNDYAIITHLRPFSSLKIRHVIDGDLSVLQNNLNPVVLTTKEYMDKMPASVELLKISNYIQNTIYSPSYLNSEFLNFPMTSISRGRSLLGSILDTEISLEYHESVNDFTSVDIFVLYETLLHIFNNASNFYDVIVFNLYESDTINKDLIKEDFYEFIIHNYRNVEVESLLDKMLSGFILKNIFNIFNPGTVIKDDFRQFIKTTIYPDLIVSFNNFVDNDIQEDFKKEFNLKYINLIRNTSFFYIFQDIIKNNDLSTFFVNPRDRRLDDIFCGDFINSFLNEFMTGNNIKDYLTPVYLYKNDSLKFLNSIHAFVQLYFENELKPKLDFVQHYRYVTEVESIIQSLTSTLNIPHIKDYLESFNLQQLCFDYEIPQFISFLLGSDIIHRFCNSDHFNNFIISFLEKANNYLYSVRLINYDYNWFTNIDLIRHNFMVYFLKYVNSMEGDQAHNILFQSFENHISSLIDDTLRFETTESNIEFSIDTLSNNKNIQDSAYNISCQLLESTITKQICFQVLSYFAND